MKRFVLVLLVGCSAPDPPQDAGVVAFGTYGAAETNAVRQQPARFGPDIAAAVRSGRLVKLYGGRVTVLDRCLVECVDPPDAGGVYWVDCDAVAAE